MIYSLRVRLILLVLLAIVPAFVMMVYSAAEQRQRDGAQAQETALRLARLASSKQEELIEDARHLLIALAQISAVRGRDPVTCSALLANLLKGYTRYANLGAADSAGDIFCSAVPLTAPVNAADRAWFQRAVQTRDFAVGEYQIGRITGRAVLVFGYPVLDEAGTVQAVVFAPLDLVWLNQLGAEAQLPEGSALTVIDRNGTILARYPDPEKWIGQSMPEASIVEVALTHPGEGTAEAAGVDGVPRLYAFTSLRGAPIDSLHVSVGIPAQVAFAEAERILVRNLAGLGLVTALGLLAAWVGGNVFILRRVDALMRATKRLAAGDLSARTGLPYGQGELSQLARAFDQMAESLEQRAAERRRAEEELRRVNRALKALSECNQALVRATEESDFLHDICRIVVQVSGYRLAWVGLAEQDENKTVRPVAQMGYEEGYLDTVNIMWADTERGRGPTGTAIRTGKPSMARNILVDPNFAPWRAEATKRGYASSIALPLLADGRAFGALNIYAAEPNAFDDEEVKLLTELADDLAFGIMALRARAAHERAEERIQRQLQRLAALRAIDTAITASLDLRLAFHVLLDQVTTQLGVDAAGVLLLNPHTQTLEYSAGRGFRTKAIQRSPLRLGEGQAGRAALERRTINISNLPEIGAEFVRAALLQDEAFIAYWAVPLIAKGQVKGVLEAFHRAPVKADQEWLDFLQSLAGQAAIAIDNAELFEGLQRSNAEVTLAYDTTLEGWSRALDLRDKETEGHTQRVTEMTVKLARAMGMSEAELIHVRRGALLHDIGKMGVPDAILLKPGPLTEEEWAIMRQHPQYAYDMLSPITYLRPALDIPYYHHEKWDGTGYPRGLKGEQIPLAARIFAVVDVWDALRSDRPYRPAWPEERVREYTREQTGKHFDPKVVEAFWGLWDEV